MSVTSRLLERLARLPPPRTRDMTVRRDLEIPMPDGVTLLADRYRARHDGTEPVILVRSPYGRRGPLALAARAFVERGYQVVVQSCRGTQGSGGEFNAYRNEAADGIATLEWIRAQTWCTGKVAMFGPSYLGIAQWAVATDPRATLAALAPAITSSRLKAHTYPGGAFSLDSTLTWLRLLDRQRLSLRARLRSGLAGGGSLDEAFATLPLADADRTATGQSVRFYQDWLAHPDDDSFWSPLDFHLRLSTITAPVSMVTGRYDIFLPVQLADYRALRDSGREVRLTIGPWKHADLGVLTESLRDALDWFGVHLEGRASQRSSRVRVHVGGSDRWVDLDDWPPMARAVRWHLHPGGRLHPRPSEPCTPDRYRYEPASPTPSVGGSLLASYGGPRDNRALERRRDVLVYTSSPLVRDVEVVGPVVAQLHVRSTLDHTDFFVRLCDVEPSGRSLNVCDGLVRLSRDSWRRGADGIAAVDIDLWPAAHVFRRGHRIRVQVSSGAHPRFARNLGGGESLGTATAMQAADQEVWHDADHPSAILLPVRDPA